MRRLSTLAVIAALTFSAAPAAAATSSYTCPDQYVPEDGFADVPESNVHEFAIDCLVAWGFASGVAEDRFAPGETVTRGQMATFLDRVLYRAGYEDATEVDYFDDDNGNPHERSINRLAMWGLVTGVADGRYAPSTSVTRAQMATFLVRFYEFTAVEGNVIGTAVDRFADDDGNSHEVSIDKAAAYGFVEGTGDSYNPSGHVTRAQMGSFLVRLVNRMFEHDHAFHPPQWWRPIG